MILTYTNLYVYLLIDDIDKKYRKYDINDFVPRPVPNFYELSLTGRVHDKHNVYRKINKMFNFHNFTTGSNTLRSLHSTYLLENWAYLFMLTWKLEPMETCKMAKCKRQKIRKIGSIIPYPFMDDTCKCKSKRKIEDREGRNKLNTK